MKIKKRTLKLVVLALLLLASADSLNYYLNRDKDAYRVTGDRFHYSGNRSPPKYKLSFFNSTGEVDIFAVNFESRKFLSHDARVYGLLFMPKNMEKVPGIILLPGGGVDKQGEAHLASTIAGWGYAVLTIDQRGVGETGGPYVYMQQDSEIFSSGKEPLLHLSVYDALRAFDVLKEMKNVDRNSIAVAGESMGGRYAMIAAALDKRFKGAVIISSSGFHVPKESGNPFLLSIDPDNYIADIFPRQLFMLHGTNDTIVPLDGAELTFSLAKEPKRFFPAEGCGHGYCSAMDEELKEDLRVLFGK